MEDITSLFPLANNGDRDAQRKIEIAMGFPEGSFAHTLKRVQESKHAAEKGDIAAMVLLGGSYYSGFGIDQDLRLAQFWLEKAAKENDPEALFVLGRLYSSVHLDFKTSNELVTKAIEFGLHSVPHIPNEQINYVLEMNKKLASIMPNSSI